MELEPYRRALEKLVQKIDLHLEMCSDAGVQPDAGKRLTELEGKFYQLLSDVEVRGPMGLRGVWPWRRC